MTELLSADESRLKMFAVGHRDILVSCGRNPGCTCLPPDGFKILEVHYSQCHMAFLFTVQHPSFDEVPLGQEIPLHYCRCRLICVDQPDAVVGEAK